MIGVARYSLRLFGTLKNITNNTIKCERFMLNGFYSSEITLRSQHIQAQNLSADPTTKKQEENQIFETEATINNVITPKISNLSLLHDRGSIILKSQEGDEIFNVNGTANMKVEGDLAEHLLNNNDTEKKSPLIKSISSQIDRFNVSIDNGKLTFTTQNNKTYVINHTIDIKAYKQSNVNIKNESVAEKEELNIGEFYVSYVYVEGIAKNRKGNKTYIFTDEGDNNAEKLDKNKRKILTIPKTYNICNYFINCRKIILRTLEGDETFIVSHTVHIEDKKKSVNYLQKKIIDFGVFLLTKVPKKTKPPVITDKYTVTVDSGNIKLKNQQGKQTIIKYKIDIEFEETYKKMKFLAIPSYEFD